MEGEAGTKGRVCVTGAGGYIASWLVKLLLSKGYFVHDTVRDPRILDVLYAIKMRNIFSTYFSSAQSRGRCGQRLIHRPLPGDEKNSHLKKLEKATENLQLFKVDLLDYNSVASAVAGCEGVFHVASPVPLSKVANPEGSYLQVELLAPAVTGTLNVLKACSETNVKRAVVVSSVGAVTFDPNWPRGQDMDEGCWTDIEYCRTTENWYCLSKTLAEREALDYSNKHGLDVITLCPSMVIGPLLQSTLNGSTSFFLQMLKGTESIENKDWHFVDVRDVADALLLIYEKQESSGRYICAPHPASVRDMVDILKRKYPNYNYPKEYIEQEGGTVGHIGTMSLEKLQKLGWKCRALIESVVDTVDYFQEAGILSMN